MPSHPIFAAAYRHLLAVHERAWLGVARTELLAGAVGDVLEIGAGQADNLAHYPERTRRGIRRVVLAEPDPAMRARMTVALTTTKVPTEIVDAPAEALPFDDASFDVVVTTLVLCSVHDVARALGEARRVLRRGGRLLFLEHVRGEGTRARVQRALSPTWGRLMGGCALDRDTLRELGRAGFTYDVHTTIEPTWTPFLGPVVIGAART